MRSRSTMVGYREAVVFLLALQQAYSRYANVTLTRGDFSVVVYLPAGIKKHDEDVYYSSTRFDHGSMIGSITRKARDINGVERTHVLYGTDQWRTPHDPWWTESGVDLASEFGVGDDGAFCNYRCGWYQVNDVTNGVLGYREAKNGESFLKIGVGELIKGTCNACDSTDDYKFNSPYKYAKPSDWWMEASPSHDSVVLGHEATLNEHGYRLEKEISVEDGILLVKNTLTNLGRIPFATAWYSHHFFTCDSHPAGKGYEVDLDVTGTGGQYDEPGTWFWSKPLEEYATVTPTASAVQIKMFRGVEYDTKIKAEFVRDDTSSGRFTIKACGTRIEETIPETRVAGGVSMYAYNLYIESGTFSPEPQVYIHLWPGETQSWTQRLVFQDDIPASGHQSDSSYNLKSIAQTSSVMEHPAMNFVIFMMAGTFLALFVHWSWRRQQHNYTQIPDH